VSSRKTLDELKEIIMDKHCKMMAEACIQIKVLMLFIHHPNENEQRVKDELSHGANSYNSDKEEDCECDSDEDPAWYDSDYDMKEDDDLF